MGASTGGGDEDTISAINITPFVDIILVVLIIFIVTTPMIMNPNIKITLPKAAAGDDSSEPPKFAVGITAKGGLYLNGKETSEKDFAEKAKESLARDKALVAIISADKDATHGRVMQVMGWAKREGITKFAFSIDNE